MTDEKGRILTTKLDQMEAAASGLKDMLAATIKGENELSSRMSRLATRISTFAGDHESAAMKTTMLRLSETIEKLQAQRTAMCARLEARCVAPLVAHMTEVKGMKQNLKNREVVMQRMLSRRKNLERVREKNPGDRVKIPAAQGELTEATTKANEANTVLNEFAEKFEKKKNAEIKIIYRELIHAQMTFSAKSLEMWTACADVAETYDVAEGLADLHALLYPEGSAAAEAADNDNDYADDD